MKSYNFQNGGYEVIRKTRSGQNSNFVKNGRILTKFEWFYASLIFEKFQYGRHYVLKRLAPEIYCNDILVVLLIVNIT